ncbi:3-isopropylmalate dehydrogenase [Brucepastera parasyntrophica]|uniref:3-isopropylmalate dehydrogenase n=1 Tax=Brucepastera parasyntrophica TaxID=2880008 RepID=UPI00210B2F0B|nr:3-isopropylmalate dehydrogenase [Brucepastera parasyntrophica]ULQ59659.1 3-isopropylmalate dehydrogenase [Brucepastera parasyntrophica]
MKYNIALIPGDGIGPDIVREACRALDAVGLRFGHAFVYTEVLAGGAAIDSTGHPLPEETLETCKKADAVLLGAVGGPKWDTLPGSLRPEKALLGLRGGMQVYANLRPALMLKQLADACPLKPEVIGDGLDILIIRELTGGIYFGDRGRSDDNRSAWDTEAYSWDEIARIIKIGFESALKRKKRLCVVDKANILETSRLWREVAESMKHNYPEVVLSYMYVDNAAMQLVRNPGQFDVIATSNMFGDILSDEASQITGSIGMLASASLGDSGPGLYEPIHGSAPDIAGQDKANPLATILSCAMMLRYSFNLEKEAWTIERAVERVLDDGWRTGDIAGTSVGSLGDKLVGTTKMGDLIVDAIGKV